MDGRVRVDVGAGAITRGVCARGRRATARVGWSKRAVESIRARAFFLDARFFGRGRRERGVLTTERLICFVRNITGESSRGVCTEGICRRANGFRQGDEFG